MPTLLKLLEYLPLQSSTFSSLRFTPLQNIILVSSIAIPLLHTQINLQNSTMAPQPTQNPRQTVNPQQGHKRMQSVASSSASQPSSKTRVAPAVGNNMMEAAPRAGGSSNLSRSASIEGMRAPSSGASTPRGRGIQGRSGESDMAPSNRGKQQPGRQVRSARLSVRTQGIRRADGDRSPSLGSEGTRRGSRHNVEAQSVNHEEESSPLQSSPPASLSRAAAGRPERNRQTAMVEASQRGVASSPLARQDNGAEWGDIQSTGTPSRTYSPSQASSTKVYNRVVGKRSIHRFATDATNVLHACGRHIELHMWTVQPWMHQAEFADVGFVTPYNLKCVVCSQLIN